MNPAYQSWLEQRGFERRTAQTYISDVRRIEGAYGNLDELYDRDKLTGVLRDLEYSKDDERQNRPNTSKIAVDASGGSPYKALASYRTAVRTYCKFREEIEGRWDYFLGEARKLIEDGTLDKGESYKEEHLGPAVSKSREALLANDGSWPELTKAAITHTKNNLIDRRSYVSGNESNQRKVVRWIEESETEVHTALTELWAEDERSPGDRIRAFDTRLPTDVFGQGQKSPRLDVASYLLMALDISQFPPCRIGKFRVAYGLLLYAESTAEDLGAEYENAIRFLDDILAEAAKRNMDRPATRLDAQSVVWSLSNLRPPSQATDDQIVDDGPLPPAAMPAATAAVPLNTILCGPPGTGKTYDTFRRCVKICDGRELEGEELRARYDELMELERIQFVTFHQSYGYEEFVEGIRPQSQGGQISYAVEDGILKRMARAAMQAQPDVDGEQPRTMPSFDDIWSRLERDVPRVVRGKSGKEYELEIAHDKVVLRPRDGGQGRSKTKAYIRKMWELREHLGRPRTATPARMRELLGRTTTPYSLWVIYNEMWQLAYGGEQEFDRLTGDIALRQLHGTPRDALFLMEGAYQPEPKSGSIIDRIYQILGDSGEPMAGARIVEAAHGFTRPNGNVMHDTEIVSTLRWLVEKERLHMAVPRLGDAVPSSKTETCTPNPHDDRCNFVLVIDEINRANISKVMGELITLLEEDKREGAENEITVTLPYSREPFTLPSNLHILGTMNTADRSIALLDTALRRRFRFEEISPQPDLLQDAAERTKVDLPSVVIAINKRIEYLVDRDHLIGHAWFMDAKDRADVDGVMRHKVIPLIAEYFYDDWSKVRAVLGGTDDFVKSEPLSAPPGLDDAMGEDRYSWTIREQFTEDAYENLVAGHRSDGSE